MVRTATNGLGVRPRHRYTAAMPPYRNLKAWEHAERLAVECVKASRGFPEFEQHSLADQLRRAAYSVPLNIAEGSAKRGSREYRRYLDGTRLTRRSGNDAGHGPLPRLSPSRGVW